MLKPGIRKSDYDEVVAARDWAANNNLDTSYYDDKIYEMVQHEEPGWNFAAEVPYWEQDDEADEEGGGGVGALDALAGALVEAGVAARAAPHGRLRSARGSPPTRGRAKTGQGARPPDGPGFCAFAAGPP